MPNICWAIHLEGSHFWSQELYESWLKVSWRIRLILVASGWQFCYNEVVVNAYVYL
jgi:hypothetical protein